MTNHLTNITNNIKNNNNNKYLNKSIILILTIITLLTNFTNSQSDTNNNTNNQTIQFISKEAYQSQQCKQIFSSNQMKNVTSSIFYVEKYNRHLYTTHNVYNNNYANINIVDCFDEKISDLILDLSNESKVGDMLIPVNVFKDNADRFVSFSSEISIDMFLNSTSSNCISYKTNHLEIKDCTVSLKIHSTHEILAKFNIALIKVVDEYNNRIQLESSVQGKESVWEYNSFNPFEYYQVSYKVHDINPNDYSINDYKLVSLSEEEILKQGKISMLPSLYKNRLETYPQHFSNEIKFTQCEFSKCLNSNDTNLNTNKEQDKFYFKIDFSNTISKELTFSKYKFELYVLSVDYIDEENAHADEYNNESSNDFLKNVNVSESSIQNTNDNVNNSRFLQAANYHYGSKMIFYLDVTPNVKEEVNTSKEKYYVLSLKAFPERFSLRATYNLKLSKDEQNYNEKVTVLAKSINAFPRIEQVGSVKVIQISSYILSSLAGMSLFFMLVVMITKKSKRDNVDINLDMK